jgi:type I restriction enzyme M protein
MRKSLGEKRKEISQEQIAEITRLYGDFTESDKVKIFENAAFGYQRITVERPLRVRFEVTAETKAALKASKVYATLIEKGWGDIGPDEVAGAFDAILAKVAGQVWEMQDDAETPLARATVETWAEMGWEIDVEAHATGIGAFAEALEVKPAQGRQLLDCLKVRDENAPVVLDAKGSPEPDTVLRDNENVPLPAGQVVWEADLADRLATALYRNSIDAYMSAEVLPYVSDAWVDHDKSKVGYEIPLTRHFYRYIPPRPLADIDAEIKQLEAEIQELLREVAE